MSTWDMTGGSTAENCFKLGGNKHKVNIVFNGAYVGHWGAICYEWYLYTLIILIGVLVWLPTDIMPSPCLKWFTLIFLFPPVIGHLCVWLRKRLNECKGGAARNHGPGGRRG